MTTFVDTSVWLMAVGGPHEHRAHCRAFLERAAADRERLHISVEVVQEFVFHRMRRTDRASALAQARGVQASAVLAVCDGPGLDLALELIETTSLRGRDAFHVAVARRAGCDALVSLDRAFADAPGLRWIDPSRP